MSALKTALKDLKLAVLESGDEDADLPPPEALLHISLIALRQLEASARSSEDETLADAAKHVRKELKRCREETCTGTKRSRAEAPADTTASASTAASSSSQSTRDEKRAHDGLHLGQYATTDAFDNNERKKNKFARLLGGGKATVVTQPRNTVVASSASVKEMNRVLENQYEDALKRGKKKGLGA